MNKIKQNNKLSIALLFAAIAIIAAAVIMLPQAFNAAHAKDGAETDVQKTQVSDQSSKKAEPAKKAEPTKEEKDIQPQQNTIAAPANNTTSNAKATPNSVPGIWIHSKDRTTPFSILGRNSDEDTWTDVEDASFYIDPIEDEYPYTISYSIKEEDNTKILYITADGQGMTIDVLRASFYPYKVHENPFPSEKITITEDISKNLLDVELDIGSPTPTPTDASVSVSAAEGGYIIGEPLEFDASKSLGFYTKGDILVIGNTTYQAKGNDSMVFDKWTSDGVTAIPEWGTISQCTKFIATFKDGIKFTFTVDDPNAGCYIYDSMDDTRSIVNEYSVMLSAEPTWNIEFNTDYNCWIFHVIDPSLSDITIYAYRTDDTNIGNWNVEPEGNTIHISGVAPVSKINVHSKDNISQFYSSLDTYWDSTTSANYDYILEDASGLGLNGCKIEEWVTYIGEKCTSLIAPTGNPMITFNYLDEEGNVGENIPANKITIDAENNEIVVDTSKEEPIDASVWIEADEGGHIDSSSPLEIHIDKAHTATLNNDTHELVITDQTTNTEYSYKPVADGSDSQFKYWVVDSVPYESGKLSIIGDTHILAHFVKGSSPQPDPDPDPQPGGDSKADSGSISASANASAQTGDFAPFLIGAIVAAAAVAAISIISQRKLTYKK